MFLTRYHYAKIPSWRIIPNEVFAYCDFTIPFIKKYSSQMEYRCIDTNVETYEILVG